MTGFVPRVTPTRKVPPAAVMAWAQRHADTAYGRFRMGADGLETDAVEICAARGAVAPHTDHDGTVQGMRVVGLVLRSDGHRLHSRRLVESGVTEGLPLEPGTLYEIDCFDEHWTTVPDGRPDAEIIFTVAIMFPDGRTAKKLAHDLSWTVIAASIEALRA